MRCTRINFPLRSKFTGEHGVRLPVDFNAFEIAYVALCAVISVAYFWVRRWKRYDPSWLVALAEEQMPGETKLHDELKRCTRIRGNDFVNPNRPNQPGSEWQFDRSITLEDSELGEIVLDILKDGRVGSIEYLGCLLKRDKC